MNIEERIREFLIANFYLPAGFELRPSTSLLEGGIVDSTGLLEVVTYLENEFGIAVDDLEMVPQNLDSIARITSFVQRKLDAQRAPALVS